MATRRVKEGEGIGLVSRAGARRRDRRCADTPMPQLMTIAPEPARAHACLLEPVPVSVTFSRHPGYAALRSSVSQVSCVRFGVLPTPSLASASASAHAQQVQPGDRLSTARWVKHNGHVLRRKSDRGLFPPGPHSKRHESEGFECSGSAAAGRFRN